MSDSDAAKATVLNPNNTRISGATQHKLANKTGNPVIFNNSLKFIKDNTKRDLNYFLSFYSTRKIIKQISPYFIMKELYDNPDHVKATFDKSKLHKYLLIAQKTEFIELKKAIKKLYKKKKVPLTILDIGIGDSRLLNLLVKEKEIWSMIKHYDGIDVAQNCINISKKVINNLKIEKKVDVKVLDAINLKKLNKKYDLIISTWFTVGNFYPSKFDFKKFKPGYNMKTNDKFTTIFKQAYNLLNSNGKIIIGSIYIDNEETRKKQEKTYKHFGWTIITNKKDCFTATKEGWWSQRFTKQRVYDYLKFIPKNKISFTSLDTYNYAMMVILKK